MTISRIGSATGTNTATMPSHQAGDTILVYAYRDGNTAAPTVPGGYATLAGGTGNNTNSDVLASKVAASGSETVGTFTNATSVIVEVWRTNSPRGLMLGTPARGSGSSTTVSYPALASMLRADGTSWVLGFAGHRSIDTNVQNAPTGMTNVTSVLDATDEAAAHDTNGGVSSWSNQNVSVGGTSSGWRSITVELAEVPVGLSLTDKSANAAVSADRMVVSSTNDGASVRTNTSFTNDVYGEFKIGTIAGSGDYDLCVGVSTAAGDLTEGYSDYPGDDGTDDMAGLYFTRESGVHTTKFLCNDTEIDNPALAVVGSTNLNIGIFVKKSVGKWWARALTGTPANDYWNGDASADPDTNTGGYDISTLNPGALSFLIKLYPYGSGTQTVTVNFGSSAYIGTPPAGAVNLGVTSTTYPKSLTATVSTSASLGRSAGKRLTATVATAAAVTKAIARSLLASVSTSATARKGASKSVAASVATSAALATSRVFTKVLTATVSTSASMAKGIGKVLAATVAGSASLRKAVAKSVSASVATSATARKSVGKALSASVALSAGFDIVLDLAARIKVYWARLEYGASGTTYFKELTANVATSAALQRATGKTLAASVATSALLRRSVGKVSTASVATSATLRRAVAATRSASVSVSASLFKQARRTLSATVTTGAALARSVGKRLTATVSTGTSLAKAVAKGLTASVATTAALAVSRAYLLILTATVTVSASVQRRAGKVVSATVSSAATLRRGIGKTVMATVGTVTALRKMVGRGMTATVSTQASLGRQIGKAFTAAVSTAGSLGKGVAIGLSVAVSVAAAALIYVGDIIPGLWGRLPHLRGASPEDRLKGSTFLRRLRGSLRGDRLKGSSK